MHSRPVPTGRITISTMFAWTDLRQLFGGEYGATYTLLRIDWTEYDHYFFVAHGYYYG